MLSGIEITTWTRARVYCSASLTVDYSRFSVPPPREHFFSWPDVAVGPNPLALLWGPGLHGVVFA